MQFVSHMGLGIFPLLTPASGRVGLVLVHGLAVGRDLHTLDTPEGMTNGPTGACYLAWPSASTEKELFCVAQ
jgi:hypothetical protein